MTNQEKLAGKICKVSTTEGRTFFATILQVDDTTLSLLIRPIAIKEWMKSELNKNECMVVSFRSVEMPVIKL